MQAIEDGEIRRNCSEVVILVLFLVERTVYYRSFEDNSKTMAAESMSAIDE
jgi:hypothetical protein